MRPLLKDIQITVSPLFDSISEVHVLIHIHNIQYLCMFTLYIYGAKKIIIGWFFIGKLLKNNLGPNSSMDENKIVKCCGNLL